MKKNQQVLKLFVVLVLSTAYVFGFSQYGLKVFGALFPGEKGYLPGTAVGSVNLEGKTPKEALPLLEEAVANWQGKSTYKMHFKEKTIDLETARIAFDPAGTLSTLVDGRQNAMRVSLDETALVEWINLISPALIGEEINLKDLAAKLTEPAKMLNSGEFIIGLGEFLENPSEGTGTIATGTIVEKDSPYELEVAVKEFSGVKIEGDSEFSFNRFVEKQEISGLSSKTLSMMATALYIAILQTNFEIVERNISKELPDYSKLGSEAFVDTVTGRDFIFKNPNADSFELSFGYSDGTLTASITGSKFLYAYKAVADNEETFKPKTIKQFSPLLKAGQVNITEEGKQGSIIKIYREVYSEGNLLETIFIAEDYYPPVHRIEVHALLVGETQQPPGTTPLESPGDNAASPVSTDETNTEDPELPPNAPTETGEDSAGPGQAADDGGTLWGKPNEVPK
ncbi:VanW family protein [Bacillus sp. FJAT-27445]|uniref:VanW family protein n=1 Tax=Bacillus sp. FJAT-27445 TaxID=1679166 RepID=UPI0007433F6B|nr:VanW family protein [Bacillus sp. FJAT-27445]